IVFYDIPSSLPTSAFSANTWKTRYALNYKGVAYKTVWRQYPKIEPQFNQIGAAPTGKKPDGSPHFTAPVIHDPSYHYNSHIIGATIYISDSTKIAAYLHATYLDRSLLMPAGTIGRHRAFEDAVQPLIA
ncbi:hypothetical protein DFH07DRAFT_758123, partial [Mycena maculata]